MRAFFKIRLYFQKIKNHLKQSKTRKRKPGKSQNVKFAPFVLIGANVWYMESCVFACEDFPKENQKLANEQQTLVKLKLAIFYILCYLLAF